MKMMEGQIHSETDILESEGKREEKTKILLAYGKAGRKGTEESPRGRTESLQDFRL